MAQIDLRHAKIYIKDGTHFTGAINQSMTPPANGDTSITVNGFSKAIPTGNQFTVVGSTGIYTVTGTTGGSTPTAIQFTPPLTTAAGIPVNNAVVTIGPNFVEAQIGEGNLTYEEKRDIEYVREKRQISLGFVRLGDDQPMDVSLDCVWEFLSGNSGDPPTMEEAFKGEGGAASWMTTGADVCEPFSVDLEILYFPPCSGINGEKIQLKEFRWESIPHDLKAGTFSAKGKCKILEAVKTRASTLAI